MKVIRGSLVLLKEIKSNGLYILQSKIFIELGSTMASIKLDNTTLWHRRLRHISERGISELCKQGLIEDTKVELIGTSEHCIYGKQTSKFGKAKHTTKGILEYVHVDLWRPSQTPYRIYL